MMPEKSCPALNQIFTLSDNDRRKENGFKLKKGRFKLDTRRKFFI